MSKNEDPHSSLLGDDSFRLRISERERGMFKRLWGWFGLRRRIMAGALIVTPVIISFLPVWFVYPYLLRFAQRTLGMGENVNEALAFFIALALVLASLYAIGLMSATFLVRWMLHLGEKILTQIPVVNFFYKIPKQVVDLIATSQAKPFRKVVLIEYPRKGIWAMGFVTGDDDYPERLGRMVHVFLPTTPNPTSGYLLLLSPDQVWETGLSVDDGVRFIISGGILDMGELRLRTYRDETPPNEEIPRQSGDKPLEIPTEA